VLDASPHLAPLPLAMTLGLDSVSVPLVNVMTLQVNGNALTSRKACGARWKRPRPTSIAAAMRRCVAARSPPSCASAPPPGAARRARLGVPLLGAELHRAALACVGRARPDRDVRLTVVPPPHTVAHLSGGVIDGYCVGEPWNQRAGVLGIGRIALTGPDIWRGHAEKVLGTTEAWAEASATLQALIKALLEACTGSTSRPTAPRRRAAGEPALPQHAGRGDRAHARPAGLPLSSIATTPTSRGAATPTGSCSRWCAGARRAFDRHRGDRPNRVYRTDLYPRRRAEMGVACPERSPAAGGHGEPLLPPSKPSQELHAAYTFGRLSHDQASDAATSSRAHRHRRHCWARRAGACRRVPSPRPRARDQQGEAGLHRADRCRRR
jgi:hypothetical protein